MSRSFSRRSFLGGIGLGALGAALPWIRSPRAFADTPSVPLRIVFVHGGSGALPGSWEPLPVGGAPSATETRFALNSLHAPLEPYESRLLLMENLDMVSAENDSVPAMDAHANGRTHALVAHGRFSPDTGGAISIDQRIAQHFTTPTPVTALPSLEVAASDDILPPASPSFSGAGMPVPFLLEPTQVWNRVFPTPLDGASVRATQDAQVFDFVRSEQAALAARMGAGARTKLEAHLDARSDLEARLGISSSRAVNRPDASLVDPWRSVEFDYNVPESGKHAIWDATAELNIRIAVAALHTDTTRVATIDLADCPGFTFGYSDGMYGSDNTHDLTHKVNAEGTPQNTDPAARGAIHAQHLATMDKVRLLLDTLASAPETDGQSLLDHTLVVFTSEIADGSHSLQRLPWFVVGSGHGFFRTGRYVRLPRGSSGRPHNDLFVSLAQAMGLSIGSFGDPNVCTGALTELHA